MLHPFGNLLVPLWTLQSCSMHKTQHCNWMHHDVWTWPPKPYTHQITLSTTGWSVSFDDLWQPPPPPCHMNGSIWTTAKHWEWCQVHHKNLACGSRQRHSWSKQEYLVNKVLWGFKWVNSLITHEFSMKWTVDEFTLLESQKHFIQFLQQENQSSYW